MAGALEMLIDGAPATATDLAYLARVNYGAYTSFRVEAGGVRGLDLHLARLAASGRELFGAAVAEARLRELMRQAIVGGADGWMRVSLFSPGITPREPGGIGSPKVAIGVFPPPLPLADGVRLQTRVYEREAPHLKHTANFGLIRERRAARADGFDDVLFVDAGGRVSEGSLWNIGFIDGGEIVWPEAPMLAGVTQALLEQGLATAGLSSRRELVAQPDLARFEGAFLCNSATPACAVSAIGDQPLDVAAVPVAALRAIWASQPCQPI